MENNSFDRDHIEKQLIFNDIGLPDNSDADVQGPSGTSDDKPLKMELYDWLQCIVAAIVAAILIFTFAVRVIGVDGTSMYPTLHDRDNLLTSKILYTPEYGDIVVFRTKSYGNEPLVKRVIATAGQTVDIDFDEGIVYIDGVALEEDYIYMPTTCREDFMESVYVPEGYVFVMGDNRNDSTDSRSNRVGLVDVRDILGKVYLILTPGVDSETEKHIWSRIGSPYQN